MFNDTLAKHAVPDFVWGDDQINQLELVSFFVVVDINKL